MMSFGISYVACYFVGTLYPMYASYKALATPGTKDDAQWLTYWIVFGVLSSLEAVVQTVFAYFPLYFEAKLLGLIWLMAPKTKGAQLIYDQFVSPFLVQHAAKFDPVFATTKLAIDNAQIDKLVALAQQYGPEVAKGAIVKAASDLAMQQEGLDNQPNQNNYGNRTPAQNGYGASMPSQNNYGSSQNSPNRGNNARNAQPMR